MLRVGLTGGIGSGKSTVARMFEVLGIPVYYADTEAKRLMSSNADLRNKIISAFGPDAYGPDGLNRQYISGIVFNDPGKLDLLNSIVHPATIAAASEWFKLQDSQYAIKEAALIFESGSQEELDIVIGVSAPEELRIRRAMDRDGITREEVVKRLSRQMPENEKLSRCDHIIINDGQHAVIPQVIALDKILKATSVAPALI